MSKAGIGTSGNDDPISKRVVVPVVATVVSVVGVAIIVVLLVCWRRRKHKKHAAERRRNKEREEDAWAGGLRIAPFEGARPPGAARQATSTPSYITPIPRSQRTPIAYDRSARDSAPASAPPPPPPMYSPDAAPPYDPSGKSDLSESQPPEMLYRGEEEVANTAILDDRTRTLGHGGGNVQERDTASVTIPREAAVRR